MKNKKILIITFVVFAVLLISAVATWYFFGKKQTDQVNVPPTSQDNNQGSNTEVITPAPVPVVAPVTAILYYPMTNYASRITVRSFGQLVRTSDIVSPCGAPFSGYHDADDLEVTAGEVSADVPVYAISAGTVRQIGPVSGYGGLLVLGVTINGQSYTVYYGHINLGSTALRVGDAVTAGQKIASLGAQCSVQTSGERKHLHFAMRVGNNIDVRGYVPTLGILASWVNPKSFLSSNSAAIVSN